MTSSKKGNQCYFAMKAHIGVDTESGPVHTAGVTTGKVHDAKVMYNLIRESPDSYDDRLGPDKKISGSATATQSARRIQGRIWARIPHQLCALFTREPCRRQISQRFRRL